MHKPGSLDSSTHTRQESSMSSTVVISKSPPLVVAPWEEPADAFGDIHPSSYDKMIGAFPVITLLVFEHPMEDPVETIKKGLSKSLVHYYPVAGRLDVRGGQVIIRCTGEGVLFVAASASCAIKDVKLSDPSLKEELAVSCRAPDGSEPLLLVQVTVFSCGGFVVGMSWNHAVGDAAGFMQFINAVGELARGMPSPSVIPVRLSECSLTRGLPPSCTDFNQFKRTLQPSQMALLELTVPSSLIDRIKGKFSSRNHGRRPCSVFHAVAAVLWRCRTRATMPDAEALAVLTFASNARPFARAKEGYYGNCVMPRLVMATSGTVANGDVVDLVEMIQRARVPDPPALNELRPLDGYNLLGLTNWRNLGIEETDFGAGRPARAMGHWRNMTVCLPLCATCIPCGKDEEYTMMSICVREEHAGAFLQELAIMGMAYNPLTASSKL